MLIIQLALIVVAFAFRKKTWVWIPALVSCFGLSLRYVDRPFGFVESVIWLAGVIVATYYFRKKIYVLAYLLILPAIAGFMFYHYLYYTGVIDPLRTLLIAAAALMLAMYVTDLVKLPWKFLINCSMAAIIVLTMIFALPTYSASEARETVSRELGSNVQLNNIMRYKPRTFFIKYGYVFEDDETYIFFNPVTGEWRDVTLGSE